MMERWRLFLYKIILRLVMLSMSKHQKNNLKGLLQSPLLKQLPRRCNISIANRQKASTTPVGSHIIPANAIHKYRHCKRRRLKKQNSLIYKRKFIFFLFKHSWSFKFSLALNILSVNKKVIFKT